MIIIKKFLIYVLVILIAIDASLGLYFFVYRTYDISKSSVQIEHLSSFVYTGKEIHPEFEIKDKKGRIIPEDCYEVSYDNCKNSGTAIMTIKGVGHGYKEKSINYYISKVDIKELRFVDVKIYSDKTMDYKVFCNGVELKEGEDFVTDVEFDAKNENAKLTFNGKNNVTGKYTMSAIVRPSKPGSPYFVDTVENGPQLRWTSSVSKAKFDIYETNENGDELNKIQEEPHPFYNIDNKNSKKEIYYLIKPFVVKDGKKYYGINSDVIFVELPPETPKMEFSYNSNTSLTVKWNHVSEASGYEISCKQKNKEPIVRRVSATETSSTFYVDEHIPVILTISAYRQGKTQEIKSAEYSVVASNSYDFEYVSYQTHYVNKPNRTQNLKIASAAINNTIIYPGETFSFNDIVGKRTWEKGYRSATVFTGATRSREALGGGICQVASTIFNVALEGDLDIKERHQHSQRVSYVPLGRDAAIYWKNEDLKFVNNLNTPIKIKMTCKNGVLTCKFMTCVKTEKPNIKLNVYRNGKNFYLYRKNAGKIDYKTYSYY